MSRKRTQRFIKSSIVSTEGLMQLSIYIFLANSKGQKALCTFNFIFMIYLGPFNSFNQVWAFLIYKKQNGKNLIGVRYIVII